MRIDLGPPTPRDPFYRCPAWDLSLVRRADPTRGRCETRFAQSSPPLASRLCGGLQRDGSARAAAARSQARPRGVRALSREHLRAAPRLEGARHVGSDAKEGVRASPIALGTRPQGSPDRRWHSQSFESADALRPVSSQEERSRAQRAGGANPGARARRVGGRRPRIGTPGCALAFGQSSCGVAGFRSGILLLDVDGPQVEFSVDPRRAPVEAARDRSGESEESIDDAVFGARHAQELGVERV